MMNYTWILLVLLFAACSGGKNTETGASKEELKANIQEMNDSLGKLYAQVMNGGEEQVNSLAIYETVNRYLAYYRAFPDDAYSAECLDRVHQLYLQEKAYDMSVAYGDTLLQKFPNYAQRASVLMSLGSTYDLMLNNRIKVKKYYEQLLKEFPKLDAEMKQQIQFRLKHIDKSFDEMIEMQLNATAKK